MLAIALALASSAAWGVADFLGGLKSRTLDVLAVLLVSQLVALAILATAAALRGEEPPGGDTLAYAAFAGAGGVMGLAAFYRGLASGAMAVVAPIGGLGAALPVIVGVASGDRPSGLQVAGMVVALAGVVLVSREERHEDRAPSAAAVGLALLAALGFGLFLTAMDVAGDDDVLWALLVARLTSVTLLLVAAAALRPDVRAAAADPLPIVAIGVFDMAANGLYALAATEGLVSVVSVLSSLYPVVTVGLAWWVLRERVGRVRGAGVALALGGAALLAAG